jgi:quinolinate synthase
MTTLTQWTTDTLYNTLKSVTLGGNICLYTPEICEQLVPKINRINTLKQEKNAIILAHSYVVPEITSCVADFVGDSYGLSKQAKSTEADIIVFAAVKFMAETAKLLNPTKQVYIPSSFNGCSLADSITADDVKALKKHYPNYAFMCYINTTASVKAECDVCVTSSNVYDIAEKIDSDYIYFLPDKLMGENLKIELKKRGSSKTIKTWDGTCYVHEEYNPEMLEYIKLKHPNSAILAHPECSPEIITHADYTGSTSQMIEHVKTTSNDAYVLLTECGLTSRLQTELPSKRFVGSCTMCKYMKANSLDAIEATLESPSKDQEITLDESTSSNALKCVEKMFELSN